MQIRYTGLRKPGQRFRVLIQATGTSLMVSPEKPLDLGEEDGQALLDQYPSCFEAVKGKKDSPVVAEPIQESVPDEEDTDVDDSSLE